MHCKFIDEYLKIDDNMVLEQYPLSKCAKDRQLMSFNHNGYWQPMDTFREFEALNNLWASGKAPWKLWE